MSWRAVLLALIDCFVYPKVLSSISKPNVHIKLF